MDENELNERKEMVREKKSHSERIENWEDNISRVPEVKRKRVERIRDTEVMRIKDKKFERTR